MSFLYLNSIKLNSKDSNILIIDKINKEDTDELKNLYQKKKQIEILNKTYNKEHNTYLNKSIFNYILIKKLGNISLKIRVKLDYINKKYNLNINEDFIKRLSY